MNATARPEVLPPVLRTVAGSDLVAPPAKLDGITGSDNLRFSKTLINAVANTVWHPEGLPPELARERATAAILALRAFLPRDEPEAIECLRRAMLPPESASRLRREAADLSRAAAEMIETLDRRRGQAAPLDGARHAPRG